MKDRYTHPYLELGSPVVAASKYRFWRSPKIVIAGLTKRIEAVYVESPLALGVGAYGIYDLAGYEPYAVTAVLNSTFMSSYLRAAFHGKQPGRRLPGAEQIGHRAAPHGGPGNPGANRADRPVQAAAHLPVSGPAGRAGRSRRAEQRIDEIVDRLFRGQLPDRR